MEAIGKTEITKCLNDLDRLLTEPFEIVICGGAAGILAHGYTDQTLDIDVLYSIPKLSAINEARAEIAERYSLNPNWLNDGAKGYIGYLPDDYRIRLIKFHQNFEFLAVFILSRIDLFIMKFAAFRPKDFQAIATVKLTNNEIKILKTAIEKISSFDKHKAYLMELWIKEKGI